MKATYEEQELKNLIKGIIKENIGEMARGVGKSIKFDDNGNKISDVYNRGILNNVEEAYQKGAEAVCKALYEVPENKFINKLHAYGKDNKGYVKDLEKKQIQTDLETQAEYQAQQAMKKGGLIGEAQIPDSYYIDQIDWTEYENNKWKPEYVKHLMKGVIKFDGIRLFNFVPDITVTEVRGNKMYKAEDVHAENDAQFYICWRDGSKNDGRWVPGAVQAVITVNYGEENEKFEKPIIQIVKFFSKGSTDNFEGKLYAGAFVPLYDKYGNVVTGRTVDDKDTGNKTSALNLDLTTGPRMILENFDWEEFRKYCNKELINRPIPSIDDRFIKNSHRPVWGLNKLNNDNLS